MDTKETIRKINSIQRWVTCLSRELVELKAELSSKEHTESGNPEIEKILAKRQMQLINNSKK